VDSLGINQAKSLLKVFCTSPASPAHQVIADYNKCAVEHWSMMCTILMVSLYLHQKDSHP
jgi:hypothetical protein